MLPFSYRGQSCRGVLCPTLSGLNDGSVGHYCCRLPTADSLLARGSANGFQRGRLPRQRVVRDTEFRRSNSCGLWTATEADILGCSCTRCGVTLTELQASGTLLPKPINQPNCSPSRVEEVHVFTISVATLCGCMVLSQTNITLLRWPHHRPPRERGPVFSSILTPLDYHAKAFGWQDS